MEGPYAVRVSHAFHNYGEVRVLQDLEMSVKQGTIYGLLGASGCGKTTLLSCVVGRRHLDSGCVQVLGRHTGLGNSQVPGRKIGYMPQETALYMSFTAKETLQYFAWFFGMKTDEFEKRSSMLMELLEISDNDKLVKYMSGGQKRRLSFAATLLHDAEILVLDEPTVGLDPLLREVIWQHLLHMVDAGRKTVILTTHYIEEARQAHMIGLMRNGRLMDEDSPNALLDKYGCATLEDVFLQLSVRQERHSGDSTTGAGRSDEQQSDRLLPPKCSKHVSMADKPLVQLITHDVAGDDYAKDTCCFVSKGRMKALLFKNYISVFRDPVYVSAFILSASNIILLYTSFIFGLCVFAVTCVYVGIGVEPRNLRLAVVNHDASSSERACGLTTTTTTTTTTTMTSLDSACNLTDLSCQFIARLPGDTFSKVFYDSRESATEAVRRGLAWGMLYFSDNFTDDVLGRLVVGRSVAGSVVVPDSGNIQVRLDMSNQVVSWIIWEELHSTYIKFAESILSACNYNVKLGKIPLTINEPVYGQMRPSFLDFSAPGVLNMMMYFFGVALTVWGIAAERQEGLLNRNIVAGATIFEIMFSYFLTQFVLMCCQAVLLIGFGIFVYRFECVGNLVLVVAIILLQGVSGMCYGFVISASCEKERTAIYIAVGSLVPMMLLCCVVWPAESMHTVLRYLSPFVPMTLPVHSIRAVMLRGWTIQHLEVYAGFVGSFAWILVFMVACTFIFRVHKL